MADQTLAQDRALNNPPLTQDAKEVFANEGVRVQNREACIVCGKRGTPFYHGLRDRLFDAPGSWNHFRCNSCGLVWLNPMPIAEDIHKLYKTYYTHSKGGPVSRRTMWRPKLMDAIRATSLGYKELLPGRGWSWVGRAAGLIPLLRDNAAGSLLFLRADNRGRLLDIGCGAGGFLSTMRELGWEVEGVEPDSDAARIAREGYKLSVNQGTLEATKLPARSFDAVTAHHVFEHVPDPLSFLVECRRILRPGAVLILMTPNANSLGHTAFGESWFPLDPPRHLHIFTAQAMRRAAESAGLEVSVLRTISRGARDTFIYSRLICRNGSVEVNNAKGYGRASRYGAWSFWAAEETARLAARGKGEELVLVAVKPTRGKRAQ